MIFVSFHTFFLLNTQQLINNDIFFETSSFKTTFYVFILLFSFCNLSKMKIRKQFSV